MKSNLLFLIKSLALFHYFVLKCIQGEPSQFEKVHRLWNYLNSFYGNKFILFPFFLF